MGWRDYDAGPYGATGRIASVLAVNYGTHPSSASGEEPDY
jgi:hypothetical protein